MNGISRVVRNSRVALTLFLNPLETDVVSTGISSRVVSSQTAVQQSCSGSALSTALGLFAGCLLPCWGSQGHLGHPGQARLTARQGPTSLAGQKRLRAYRTRPGPPAPVQRGWTQSSDQILRLPPARRPWLYSSALLPGLTLFFAPRPYASVHRGTKLPSQRPFTPRPGLHSMPLHRVLCLPSTIE